MTALLASATYRLIVEAAIAGVRCPMNQPMGELDPETVRKLARAGHIRIEIFGHNYRVVTLLDGPHKGKQTAPDPDRGKVYLIVGRETVYPRRSRIAVSRTPAGMQPSAPRPLRRGEWE